MLTEDQYFADEEENEDQEYCDYCGEPLTPMLRRSQCVKTA
jgi:hypothetical protein